MTERRGGGELRAEGRRLSGTVLRFGDVSPSHRERFEPRAFAFAEAVPLNLHHDAERAVAWQPGGGMTLRQDRNALTMTAELPPIPAADRALDMVKRGEASGLSVEFRAVKERQEGGLRVVESALLTGIGLVRAPSYEQSRVEARRRSGRTVRQRIPANRDLGCTCSGKQCSYARFSEDALSGMAEAAFEAREREVVAAFGSYAQALGSVSRGTLRGRMDGDGLLVEVDIPDGASGAALIAAHEDAGVVIRPFLDADRSTGTILPVEGGDRNAMAYEAARVRAFIVSATDEREGWPAPELVATPDLPELAAAAAPRRRRLWL